MRCRHCGREIVLSEPLRGSTLYNLTTMWLDAGAVPSRGHTVPGRAYCNRFEGGQVHEPALGDPEQLEAWLVS